MCVKSLETNCCVPLWDTSCLLTLTGGTSSWSLKSSWTPRHEQWHYSRRALSALRRHANRLWQEVAFLRNINNHEPRCQVPLDAFQTLKDNRTLRRTPCPRQINLLPLELSLRLRTPVADGNQQLMMLSGPDLWWFSVGGVLINPTGCPKDK